MAKEKEKKAKKPNFFKRTGTRIASFFKGIVSEIKKVTWPTKKQVVSNTLSVLGVLVLWSGQLFGSQISD